jgi:2-keto-4-pentenoate hydratase/2-oxohepta-3-ene-1,7-dioic acid hydratase in catechol pathway
MATHGEALPLDTVRLLAPLPRPGKILCSTATDDPPEGERTPLLMTLKSAESVIGPGATIELPPVSADWQFLPEVELGLVIRGPAKSVTAQDWRSAVFGYTCVVDVMPRGDTTFGRDYCLAKADTLGPLEPCIVTADESPTRTRRACSRSRTANRVRTTSHQPATTACRSTWSSRPRA